MTRTKEYTISISRANFIAMLMIVPIFVGLVTPLIILNGFDIINFKELTASSTIFGVLKFALAVTLGIFVHEFLHGLGWAVFAKKGWKSISFGVKWEYLTPYCHCSEPLKRGYFLVGAILPLIILGLIPAIYALFIASFTLWFYGFFFTIAAGGDIIAIWMLRNVRKGELVLDHPSELGFVVLDYNEQ